MKEYKQLSNKEGLIVNIISLSEITETDKVHTFLGGDVSNPSWKEYLDDYADNYKGHIELIKISIEDNGMIGYTGQDAQGLWFKFSDGEIWGFSWRAWGDLMQSIVDKNEGYMSYYM